MVNYSFLIIGLLFCVILLVELIFNFTGLLKENFKVYEKMTNEYFADHKQTIPVTLNRITKQSSEDTSTRYYNEPIVKINSIDIRNIGDLPTNLIQIYNDKKTNEMYNKNGLTDTNNDIFNEDFHFKLIRIDNWYSFNNNVGQTINRTTIPSFPFFIIKPVNDKSKFVKIDGSVITLKETFSNDLIIEKSDFVFEADNINTIDKTNGQFSINLDLSGIPTKELLSNIEGLDFNIFSPNNKYKYKSNVTCQSLSDSIPKRAVESLCLRCDPDLIQ